MTHIWKKGVNTASPHKVVRIQGVNTQKVVRMVSSTGQNKTQLLRTLLPLPPYAFSTPHLFFYYSAHSILLLCLDSPFPKFEFKISLLDWQASCQAWCMGDAVRSPPGARDPSIGNHSSEKKLSFFNTIHGTYCSHLISSFPSCNYHHQVGQGLKISSVHLCPWGLQFLNLSLYISTEWVVKGNVGGMCLGKWCISSLAMDLQCLLLVMYFSLWRIIEVLALENASSLPFCRMKCFSFSRSGSPFLVGQYLTFLSNCLAMAFSSVFQPPIHSSSTKSWFRVTHFLLFFLWVLFLPGIIHPF